MNFFKKIFSKIKERKAQNKKAKEEYIEGVLEKALETLSKFRRDAYLPKVTENSNSFSSVSKIGGLPYLRNKEDWPVCSNCNKNMQLFLQLNLEDLPEAKDTGLIQLFYCTTNKPKCELDLEAYLPFSKAVTCRKIDVQGESDQITPNIDKIYQEKIIIDWEQIDDYPHIEEYERLGINIEEHIYDLMAEREIGVPSEKDKLFGWPHWIQSMEYPFDKKTNSQMELFFQLNSEENLPFMFGDAGTGYLTQSPKDASKLAFGWSCY